MTSPSFDICTFGSLTMDIIVDIPESEVLKITEEGSEPSALKITLGEKILVNQSVYCPGGGSANCGVGFSKLGLSVAAFGNTGDDLNHDMILLNLQRNKVCIDFIKVHKGESSSSSVILHTWNGRRTVLNNRMKIDGKIDFTNLPATKAVYISHLYEASNDGLIDLVSWKSKNSGFIAWNPGKTQFKKGFEYFKAFYASVNMLILNVEEAEYFTGIKAEKIKFADYESGIFGTKMEGYPLYEPQHLHDVRALAQRFLKAGVKTVIITDGSRGTQAFTNKDHFWSPPKVAVRKDSLGAGDAFSIGAVSAALKGLDLTKQLLWGTYNATNVIQYLGAQKGQLTEKDLS